MQFKYKTLLILTPFILIFDQFTKWLVRLKVEFGYVIPVIPGYFDIVHFSNKGAAFGMFSGSDSAFRVPFFYAVSAIAVIVIVVALIKLPARDRLMAAIFSLILGGIAGNILDRIRFGEVTDFLSVHIQDKFADFVLFGHQFHFRLEWPAFNVADSAITVAMVLLIYSLLRSQKGEELNLKSKVQGSKLIQNPKPK